MKDNRCLMIVSGSVSTSHTNRDLGIAWDKLNDEFAPKDLAAKLDLKDSIRNCKLECGVNPDHWYESLNSKIVRLKVDFGETIKDEELIHIILSNLPEDYDYLKINFIRQRNSTVDPLTLGSMVEQLRDYFTYSNKANEIKMKDLALVTKGNEIKNKKKLKKNNNKYKKEKGK